MQSAVALAEVARGSKPVQIAQALAKRAFVSGSVDDIGVLVVLFDAPETQGPASPSAVGNVPTSCTATAAVRDTAGPTSSADRDAEGSAETKATNGRSHADNGAGDAGASCEQLGTDGSPTVPAMHKCADRGGHYGHSPGDRHTHRPVPCALRPSRNFAPVRWGAAALAATAAVGVAVARLRCARC